MAKEDVNDGRLGVDCRLECQCEYGISRGDVGSLNMLDNLFVLTSGADSLEPRPKKDCVRRIGLLT